MDNSRIVGDGNSGTTFVPLMVTCSAEAKVHVKCMNVCVAFPVGLGKSGGRSCVPLIHTVQSSSCVQFIKDFGIVTLKYPIDPESPETLKFTCDWSKTRFDTVELLSVTTWKSLPSTWMMWSMRVTF